MLSNQLSKKHSIQPSVKLGYSILGSKFLMLLLNTVLNSTNWAHLKQTDLHSLSEASSIMLQCSHILIVIPQSKHINFEFVYKISILEFWRWINIFEELRSFYSKWANILHSVDQVLFVKINRLNLDGSMVDAFLFQKWEDWTQPLQEFDELWFGDVAYWSYEIEILLDSALLSIICLTSRDKYS